MSNVKNAELKFGASLSWLLVSTIVLLLLKAIQHQAFPQYSSPALSISIVCIHAILLTLVFVSVLPLRQSIILIGAYFLRLIMLLIDRLTLIEIPFMEREGDASSYFSAASLVSTDLSLAGDTYGGVYTSILGYIFSLIGPDRILGQYLNLIFGVVSVISLIGILRLLQVNERVTLIVLSFAAFMPMIAINSAVFLRESLIQMLITISLFAFLKGILNSSFIWTLVSLICVLAASTFHSGVIGIMIGFAVASAFTYHKDGRLKFGLKRVAPALLLAASTVGVAIQYPELFLGKFSNLESPDEILDRGQSRLGGSAYLTNLEVENWLTFITYAPIRAFYFISSPLPWNWRGFGDILSFGVDSIVYLSAFALLFVVRIKDPNKRYLMIILVFVLLIATVIFGAGVSNTGTAIRHRAKLLALVMALLAVLLDSSKNKIFRQRNTESNIEFELPIKSRIDS